MSRSLSLLQLAARLDTAGLLLETDAPRDVMLTGIADDSRAVDSGDLFCAWAGTVTDAHQYAPRALEAGCAALLVERSLGDLPVPQLVVRDGRRATALAAAAFYGDPQDQLTLVGVTGTNGKTTSVWMLRHLLALLAPAASIGTLGALDPEGRVLPGSESLTTPGPVQLARTLRELVDRGARMLAMEVSSHALDQGRVASLRFDAALFTNLTRDHLDYHGTLERYLAAKQSLVQLLRPEAAAVINADDAAWHGLAARSPRALAFGHSAAADIRFDDVVLDAAGARFTLRTPAGQARAHLPLPGEFNVQNAVGAAAVCLALGGDLQSVVEALATLPQVPGRLEVISRTPCPVLRDYAHTPDALERALGALRPLTRGRLIVLFGAGGDRDRGKRPLMGAAAQRGADVVIVTSDNPRTETPDAIIDEIMAGMDAAGVVRITDRRDAIAYALDMAASDDVVLLAGKGHEDYQVIGTEKLSFDERVVVHDLLGAGAAEVDG